MLGIMQLNDFNMKNRFHLEEFSNISDFQTLESNLTNVKIKTVNDDNDDNDVFSEITLSFYDDTDGIVASVLSNLYSSKIETISIINLSGRHIALRKIKILDAVFQSLDYELDYNKYEPCVFEIKFKTKHCKFE